MASLIGVAVARVLGVSAIAAIIGCLSCLWIAFGSLSYSDEESADARICSYSSDVLYTYIYIGQTNEWGQLVADFWLKTNYLKLVPPERELEIRGASTYGSFYKRIITQAVNKNFNLPIANVTSEHHKDILRIIRKLKDNCEDSKRREVFSERFNDFLHYSGLATVFGFLSWVALAIPVRR